jgi:hypothetical protein
MDDSGIQITADPITEVQLTLKCSESKLAPTVVIVDSIEKFQFSIMCIPEIKIHHGK